MDKLKKTLIAGFISTFYLQTGFANERWFEVELLIFKRNDFQQLNEAFNPEINLINVNQARDLISPTYQPDNQQLRQWLGLCTKPSEPYSEALEQLEQTPNPLIYQAQLTPATELATNESAQDEFNSPDTHITGASTFNDIQSLNEPAQVQLTDAGLEPDYNTPPFDQLRSLESKTGLDIEALTFANAKPSWHFSFDCIAPPPSILNPDYQTITDLEVNTDLPSLPVTLNGNIPNQENQPYLLPADKLQFDELKGKIRWRDDMTPILHFGWRQVVRSESEESPWRIYAGQNYSQQFEYNGTVKSSDSEPEQEKTVLNVPQEADKSLAYQSVQNNIQQLLNKIDNQTWKPESALLDKQKEQQQTELKANAVPSQVWQLDGLFKIYLQHYLYIETEFNLREVGSVPTQVQAEINLNEPGVIEVQTPSEQPYLYPYYFKQNKRIISEEVHYFDHPKMGIVMQVRKYFPEKDEP